jgi:NTE family protein
VARIGLVLGAGGVTGGAFHAGVLAALAERTGWDPRRADLIVGTSAGSATAGGLRAGLAAQDMAARARGAALSDEATALLRNAGLAVSPQPVPSGPRVRLGPPASPLAFLSALRRPLSTRATAIAASLIPAGTVPTDAIVQSMDAMHPRGWPALTTWICAVRLRDAALVVFGREGSPPVRVGQAVAASCAIPGYFEPVEIDGERYIDGGAHSLTNVGEVAGEQPDLVIVSSPMSRYGPGRVQLGLELQRLRRRRIPYVSFEPPDDVAQAMGVNAMDPSRRAVVVVAAHAAARRRIDELGGRLDALRA